MNETDKHYVKTVCVCEDDIAAANSLRNLLEAERYKVYICYTGRQLLKALEYNRFDLLLVDGDVLGLSGCECGKKIRSAVEAPVIFLTSGQRDFEELHAPENGSDDYIRKPFKARELLARVKSRLQGDTGRPGEAARQERLRIGGLEVDETRYTASLHGRPLNLTPKEFAILAHLMKVDGRPLGPRDLFEAVWNEVPDSRCNNTVMVHIRHLRQKLRAADPSHEYIETVWGVGYRIT